VRVACASRSALGGSDPCACFRQCLGGCRTIDRQDKVAELRADQLPLLVTFTDLDDPKGARVVPPNNLPRAFGPFGPGVRLMRAWIEMTSDPLTRGIERKLPRLKDFKGYLGGPFDATWSRPSRNLTGNDFIKGL